MTPRQAAQKLVGRTDNLDHMFGLAVAEGIIQQAVDDGRAELLEACENIARWANYKHSDGPALLTGRLLDIEKHARAAIAKAKGE